MEKSKTSKLINYLYYPDFSNKFLLRGKPSIVKSILNFKLIFANFYTFGPTVIKAILMLESLYIKRVSTQSTIMKLKFSKTRCISQIYLDVALQHYATWLSLFMKKPIDINTLLFNPIRQAEYFAFPGFVKHLQFQEWEKTIVLSNSISEDTDILDFLFLKTAIVD